MRIIINKLYDIKEVRGMYKVTTNNGMFGIVRKTLSLSLTFFMLSLDVVPITYAFEQDPLIDEFIGKPSAPMPTNTIVMPDVVHVVKPAVTYTDTRPLEKVAEKVAEKAKERYRSPFDPKGELVPIEDHSMRGEFTHSRPSIEKGRRPEKRRSRSESVDTHLKAASGIKKWKPHFEATAKKGNDRSLSRFSLMYPIWQSSNSMVFTDFRNVLADEPTIEGNFGLGVRHIFNRREGTNSIPFIGGIYGYYDIRRSENENVYHQTTVGAELLTKHAELRGNVYLPENESNVIATRRTEGYGLHGTTVSYITTTLEAHERVLPGFDVEAGLGFDFGERSSLWAYGGYYYFAEDGFPEVYGPKGRIEYGYDDTFGLEGSKLTLGYECAYDDVREFQNYGFASMRLPLDTFNPFKKEPVSDPRLDPIDTRMMRPVERDIDLVIVSQDINAPADSDSGPKKIVHADPQTDPNTGEVMDVYFVTANGSTQGTGEQTTPMTVAQAEAASSASDVIFLLNTDGNIDSSGASGGTLTLKEDQQLIGVGSGTSQTVNFSGGIALDFTDTSGRPTITRAAGANTVTLNDANILDGVTIAGGDASLAGTTTDGLTVDDVTIQNSNSQGVSLTNPTNTIAFSNTTITGTTGAAFYVDGGDSTTTFDGTITNTSGRLLHIANTTAGSVTVENTSTLTDTAGTGILIDSADGNVTVANPTITNSTSTGIDISGGSGTFTFTGATLSGATGTAFNVDNASTATVSYTGAITNSAGRAVSVDSLGAAGSVTFEAGSSITDSGAGANTGTGILINAAAGDVNFAGSTTITESDSTGVDIQNSSGTYTFADLEVTNATNEGVRIQDNAPTVTITVDGTNGITNAADNIIEVNGTTGGTITFSGGNIVDTAGNGILLDSVASNVNIANATITNSAASGIDISAGSGTFTFTSANISGAAGSAFNLDSASTVTVSYTGSISNTVGRVIAIDDLDAGGSVTFEATSTITDSGAGANTGTGILIDSTDGNVTFNGTTTITSSDSTGVDIQNSTGTIDLTGVSITDATSTALNINGGSATVSMTNGNITQTSGASGIAVSGVTGGSLTLDGTTGLTVNSLGGATDAVSIDGNSNTYAVDIATATISLDAVHAGFDVDNLGAGSTFRVRAGSVGGTFGTAADFNASNATVNFDANINMTGGDIVNFSGTDGTYTFTNSTISANNSSTNGLNGIDFANTSGTYNFGTVNISDVTGPGVSLAISDGDHTFSYLGIANSSTNGISLDTINAGGSFTVSDGTITNSTQDGIYGTGARDVSIDSVVITGAGDEGVEFASSQNISFTNGEINNAAGDGILLTDTTGTATIQSNTIDDAAAGNNAIHVVQTGANVLTNLTIRDNTLNGDDAAFSTTERGIMIDTAGTSQVTATIRGNTIDGMDTSGIEMETNDTSSLTATITDNTIDDQDGYGIYGSFMDASTSIISIDNSVGANTISDTGDHAIYFSQSSISAGQTLDATIQGNTISNVDVAGPSHAVFLRNVSLSAGATAEYNVDNNTVNNVGGAGVYVLSQDDGAGGDTNTIDVHVTGNTIDNTDQGGNGNDSIELYAEDESTITAAITGNDVDTIVVEQTDGTATFNLEQADLAAELDALQTAGTSTLNGVITQVADGTATDPATP